MTEQPNGAPAQPAESTPYDQPAFRFTLSLDIAATNATIAAQVVMQICARLAQLATDPLGGRALHDAMGGRVLNIVSFNDPTAVTEPVDPKELSMLQDAVRAMQQGDPQALGALQGLLGLGDAPAAD
jgi:hypothetical protein